MQQALVIDERRDDVRHHRWDLRGATVQLRTYVRKYKNINIISGGSYDPEDWKVTSDIL